MIRLSPRSALIALSAFLTTPLMGAAPPPIPPLSERETFPSADGATMLVGHLFRPQGPHAARMPAVVMMHGRAGAYSAAAEGDYSAMTVSRRHQEWGASLGAAGLSRHSRGWLRSAWLSAGLSALQLLLPARDA